MLQSFIETRIQDIQVSLEVYKLHPLHCDLFLDFVLIVGFVFQYKLQYDLDEYLDEKLGAQRHKI